MRVLHFLGSIATVKGYDGVDNTKMLSKFL